jgi:hypothetical protein
VVAERRTTGLSRKQIEHPGGMAAVGAGIPPGCDIVREQRPVVSLALNHRLMADNPAGLSGKMRNFKKRQRGNARCLLPDACCLMPPCPNA